MDWCHSSNQIVTCGHDRNAVVWRFENNAWKPTLVVLRINRAATCVKWSPFGNKFAVGSGSKLVQVCSYEAENDWWISKTIKGFKSTVLSIAWCMNNKFIVTGSCDFKCRIFSAYIKGLDDAEDDGFGQVFPDQHKFGEQLAEFASDAWVEAVAWAPNGFRLAFSSHSSSVTFVQLLAGSPALEQTLRLPGLPVVDVAFLTSDSLLGVGYDQNPLLLAAEGSEEEPVWKFKEYVDKQEAKSAAKASGSAFSAARGMFSDAVNKGSVAGAAADEKKVPSAATWTKHIGCITSIGTDPKAATKFSTAGIDGRVVAWDLSKMSNLSNSLAALKLA
jgi:actin related protein 2/3 complex subunit 1A/1B